MISRPFGSLDWARRTPGIPELLDEIRQASVLDAARLPQSHFARLSAAGFGRIRIPVAEGGLGGDVLDLLDAIIAIAAADSNLAQSWRTHVLATERHVKTAPGALRDRWISRIASGAIIGGGWTEADASGPSVFTTRLSTASGSPTLTGRKFYSTGSRYADWLEYSAVDDTGELVIAAVRADGPGVALLDDWTGFGQRATASGTTVLEEAPVDPDDVAPFGSQHLGTGGWQQLTLLCVLVGIGEATRNAAAELIDLIDRAHGETPILVLEGYGRISTLVATARASLRHVGALSEEAHHAIIGEAPDAEAVAARAQNAAFQAQAVIVEQIVEAADRLMTLPAALDDLEEAVQLRRILRLERYWRNAQTIATHNPVLHRLRAIADRELYDIDRIADPAERRTAITTRIAEQHRALTVIRVAPELSARLAADRAELARVADAFRDREAVLFQFDDGEGSRFDASVAIATWLSRFPTSWFAVATGDLDAAGHPYNLARRIASLEQLSDGRTAWVVTAEADDRQREYIRIVQQLWRSWPRESIAADARAEHFAQIHAIRRIGADGGYRVAGPLNVPSSPQYLPVVVGAPAGSDVHSDVHSHVDLALQDDVWMLRHGAAHPSARTQNAEDVTALLKIAAVLAPSDGAAAQTLRARLRLPAPAIDELPTASDRFANDSETEAS